MQVVFQPSIFRCELLVSRKVWPLNRFGLKDPSNDEVIYRPMDGWISYGTTNANKYSMNSTPGSYGMLCRSLTSRVWFWPSRKKTNPWNYPTCTCWIYRIFWIFLDVFCSILVGFSLLPQLLNNSHLYVDMCYVNFREDCEPGFRPPWDPRFFRN